MHVHVLQLVVIVILACLAFYANRRLTPDPFQRWLDVLIVIVGALAILVSLGLLGGSAVGVSM